LTVKARVRGIYSTAITKMLLENGFEIVQPSLTIRKRFKLDENTESPNVDIYDRRNRQGVHVIGTAESLEALKTLFLHVSVDVGSVVGKLPSNEINPDSDNVIVQIRRKQASIKEPLFSTKISIPGECAVLIPEEKVKVSLKIHNMEKRISLVELGKRIVPSDWGVIWRTAAANQPTEVLESEIARLAKIREEIFKRAEKTAAPALLWGDQYYMNVEFPAISKTRFDEIRAQVTPTIKGHHYYKACGKRVSAVLEMAEKMLEDNVSVEEVERLFQQTVESSYPMEGFTVGIEHVKPDGKVFHLGKAQVEKCSGKDLCYSRVFKSKGFYDGLGVPKEPSDCAVTEAKIGDWYYTTRYFSKEGEYKGAHINLNTPLELYPRWIRYVDLEVDVCVFPDGAVKVLDEDELEKAVAEGFIGEKLASLAKDKVSKILESL